MVEITLAENKDFEFFYQIKCNEDNMYWAGHKAKPEYENLMMFFSKIISKQNDPQERKIYIIWSENQRCGYLYFDPIDLVTACVSIAVIDNQSGKGNGKASLRKMLRVALERGYKKIIAEIREDNTRSKRLFESVGFTEDNNSRVAKIENLDREINMIQYSINLSEG